MIAGTWGVNLVLRFRKSIAGATSAEIVIGLPNGTVLTKTATITDAATGEITYVTEQGVFTEDDKTYILQGFVYFGSERKLKTPKHHMLLEGSLQAA